MTDIVHLADIERVENSIITVGTFDGVHSGHRVLIQTVLEKSRKRNGRSVVVTFDPHPREIINPGKAGIKLLSTLEERCELLSELGIDEMVVIPFDRDFSLLTSEEFVRNIIWKKIGISEFVIGYDHQFGRNREGTIETVQGIASELEFDVYVVSRQEVGDKTISSTAIRKALQELGDIDLATRLLGRPYILNGTVVQGDKRGMKIGYPTANIKPADSRKVIPKNGVYAVKARVDGEYYDSMMNIGMRPTFDGESETIEVHLFEFDRSIYGNFIQVQFIKRIRDERRFKDVKSLKAQLDEDKIASKKALSGPD